MFLCEPLEGRVLLSRSWFVSPAGVDGNAGTIAAPLRTIQRAATLAQPGDTVYIRAGVYHETVTPARSGTAAAPITFAAYKGESVTIDGADPLTGWSDYRGAIYQAPQSWTLGEGNDQVFVDGRMINEARWPNTSLDPSHPVMATARSISTSAPASGWLFPSTATITDPALPGPAGAWNGATIHIASGQGWTFQTGTVLASGPGWLTYSYLHFTNYEVPAAGNHYYLSGSFHALDAPGEWFRDPGTGRLYVWTPNGDDPPRHLVEAKHRLYAFELSGRSYITVQGVNLFAASIDSNPASSHLTISGISAQYVSQQTINPVPWDGNNRVSVTGILLRGSHDVLSGSTIAFSSGNGVFVDGSDNLVQNCVIHDVDYAGGDEGGIAAMGLRQQVLGNTIYNAGRDGIQATYFQAGMILHNTVHDVGLQTTDLGGIYTWGTNGLGTQIAYNTVYNIRTGGFGGSGVYLDNGSSGFVIHDNVVWNVNNPLKFNPPTSGITVYHNTVNGKIAINPAFPPQLRVPPTPARLTDLGTLGGAKTSPAAVSDAGQVVGQSLSGNSSPAFFYANRRMSSLGTLGGNYSSAYAINARGQVAGTAYPGAGARHAFLDNNGRMTDLGTLPGDVGSIAAGINSFGQLVGTSYSAGALGQAFLYSGGRMQTIGTLGGSQSAAFGINDSGQIVGAAYTPGDRDVHAFFYYAGGKMLDLGTLGGSGSAALAINAKGQVVGESYIRNDAAIHAFFCANGRMTDLGALPGLPNTVATAINNNGEIVGYAYSADFTRWHAFVYKSGVMRDLNTYLPGNSGWTLTTATGINNHDQIVGAATTPAGQTRGYLLDL